MVYPTFQEESHGLETIPAHERCLRGRRALRRRDPRAGAEALSIAGGALLLLVLAIAYFCGGYVAGRMSRFDGARQGFGVWLVGLVITVAIAAAAAIFGSEWNVLGNLDLPRIPVDEGDLATGAGIALVAALVVTLLGALLGGSAGRRYHDRVDRVAIDR